MPTSAFSKPLSLLVALVVSLAATNAFAQNPCASDSFMRAPIVLAQSESGLGGTGYSGGDESGLGGTGHTGSEESGLGGTGLSEGEESGIGGTGIYGTITGFGSICINGLRVHYNDEVPVTLDGAPASSSALSVGQVVAIEANGSGNEFTATALALRSAITGPVTALDRVARQLSVMGQRVEVTADFEFASDRVALGSRATVSGLRRADGSIAATHISAAEEQQPDGVSGAVHWRDSTTLSVGGVMISVDKDFAGADALLALEEGADTQIVGSWDLEQALLVRAKQLESGLFNTNEQRLSVEGYVRTNMSDGALWLPGIELDRESIARAGGDALVGKRVQLTGRRDGQGRMHVERVRVVERPRLDRQVIRKPAIKVQPKAEPKVERKTRTKASKPDLRSDPPTRPVRPLPRPPERPKPIDRPDKIDRPTAIDSIVREAVVRD